MYLIFIQLAFSISSYCPVTQSPELLQFFKTDPRLYYSGNLIFIIGLYHLVHVVFQVTREHYLTQVLAQTTAVALGDTYRGIRFGSHLK